MILTTASTFVLTLASVASFANAAFIASFPASCSFVVNPVRSVCTPLQGSIHLLPLVLAEGAATVDDAAADSFSISVRLRITKSSRIVVAPGSNLNAEHTGQACDHPKENQKLSNLRNLPSALQLRLSEGG
jgi:hypothetical protein